MCRKEVSFHAIAEPTPGTIKFFVEDDPTMRDAMIYYANNDCCVMDVEFHGH
ncbi:hypothetical protein MTO96_035188, partial [Rhipicephalus appendiculatus]